VAFDNEGNELYVVKYDAPNLRNYELSRHFEGERGGYNPEIKKIVMVKNNESEALVYEDYCDDTSSALYEYKCGLSKDKTSIFFAASRRYHSCKEVGENYVCIDGACVQGSCVGLGEENCVRA